MRTVISVLLAISLSACGRQHDDIVSFAQQPEHGLRKDVTIGKMTYTVQYKPQAYILKMERLDENRKQEYDERMKQLEGTAWFNISFSIKDYSQSPLRYEVSGLEEYTNRQDYFLNAAARDIYLLYGKDTLYVNSYWFENNQNLTAHETMIVGFSLPGNAKKPEKDMQLSYYDRVFKNGIIKVIIKKDDVAAASES